MKWRYTKRLNLIEGGREEWERTNQYRDQVNEIVRQVTARYSTALSNERRWIKRLLIRIRVQIEIRKRVDQLSSSRNLHAMSTATLY